MPDALRTHPVDICVPVYNGAAFVAETIDSILCQSFADFRVLISVDHSDDDSAAVCRRFTGDPRVQIFEHKRRLGFVGNANFLTRIATAPYLKFAPHDDILHGDLIATLFEFMLAHPECAVAIPRVVGFGEKCMDFEQHEVRGPMLRRMLDIILNQRCVAAFHGLVRIDPVPANRPLLPFGYLRDFEADVLWMARIALRGELRRVAGASVRKRFSHHMKSISWVPRTSREARRVLVDNSARLAELAWPVCEDDEQRRQVLAAALIRVRGEGLNYGVTQATRMQPFFKMRMSRSFVRALKGAPATFARGIGPLRLLRHGDRDRGILSASRMARQIETLLQTGRQPQARDLFEQAIERDPLAGWAEPFARRL